MFDNVFVCVCVRTKRRRCGWRQQPPWWWMLRLVRSCNSTAQSKGWLDVLSLIWCYHVVILTWFDFCGGRGGVRVVAVAAIAAHNTDEDTRTKPQKQVMCVFVCLSLSHLWFWLTWFSNQTRGESCNTFNVEWMTSLSTSLPASAPPSLGAGGVVP